MSKDNNILEWGDITLNLKIDNESTPELYQYFLDSRFDPQIGAKVIMWIIQGIEREREANKWTE